MYCGCRYKVFKCFKKINNSDQDLRSRWRLIDEWTVARNWNMLLKKNANA